MASPIIFTKLKSQGNLTVDMPTHTSRQHSSRLQLQTSLSTLKYTMSSEGILLWQKENRKIRCNILQNFKYMQNQSLRGEKELQGLETVTSF